MRSLSSGLIAIAVLFVASSQSPAQQMAQLESGVRARLVSPSLPAEHQIVRIVSSGPDSVVFRSERYPVTRSLALSEISAVDVSLGQRRRTARGAAIGLVSGLAIGAVAGYATFEPCDGYCFLEPTTRSGGAAWGGLAGGVLGLVAGTTIGFFTKSEKWERVQSNTTVGVSPAGQGAAFSVSRKF